jgi:hypothetical protein
VVSHCPDFNWILKGWAGIKCGKSKILNWGNIEDKEEVFTGGSVKTSF